MTNKYQRYRTLADYRQFLHHSDPILRNWAVHCMQEQYPHLPAAEYAPLLIDSDTHLQIVALQSIGDNGASEFEPALLEMRSKQDDSVNNWITKVLGQLRSQAILPELLTDVDAAPARPVDGEEMDWLPVHSAVHALGHYPNEAARTTLWQLVERYPVEDRLMFNAVEGLMRFIRPAELSRLIARVNQLATKESSWWRITRLLAQAANVEIPALELANLTLVRLDDVLDFLDFWFLQPVPFDDEFLDTLELTSRHGYEDLFSCMSAELGRIAATRGDNLSAWREQWQSGSRPTGYPWRMIYTDAILKALANNLPQNPKRLQENAALGLTLLTQALLDNDDEAALQAAPNEMFRQATLLSIASSVRPNVLPDVVDRVAALGPAVIPHLIDTLNEENIWGWLRALPTIAKIARAHPGAADMATPAILNLIHPDQSDDVLEATSTALIAIGPGAVDAISSRLGQDYVYDIFAGGALAQIPTEASVEAWLHYLSIKGALDEYELESLVDLGHRAALEYLRDNYDWRGDPMFCTGLYKLAVVTGYDGSEVRRWRRVARQNYRAFINDLKSPRSK